MPHYDYFHHQIKIWIPSNYQDHHSKTYLFSAEHCGPGTYYNVTTHSCERCPRGWYQPHPAMNYCIRCPGNTTTDENGVADGDQCKGTLWTPVTPMKPISIVWNSPSMIILNSNSDYQTQPEIKALENIRKIWDNHK